MAFLVLLFCYENYLLRADNYLWCHLVPSFKFSHSTDCHQCCPQRSTFPCVYMGSCAVGTQKRQGGKLPAKGKKRKWRKLLLCFPQTEPLLHTRKPDENGSSFIPDNPHVLNSRCHFFTGQNKAHITILLTECLTSSWFKRRVRTGFTC